MAKSDLAVELVPVFMGPLTKPAEGWCGGMPGIEMSFLRSGTKRRLTRRERKWRREKSHRSRRHGWSSHPKMKLSGFVYFLNTEYLEMAYGKV